MTFSIAVAVAMMVLIIVLLFREVAPPGVIFSAVPILAALLMGYGPREVNGFIGDGMKALGNTIFLMAFAILYFGLLHDAGVFKALVQFIMRFLGNSVLGVLVITCLVGMGTQLDGSGATTALCTIPPMKPIYERMKIRPQALLLMESLASGTLCLLPWAPGLVEDSSYVGAEAFDVFRFVRPALIFMIVLMLLFCVPVALYEKKNGAGLTREEFLKMKEEIRESVEYPFGRKIALFDGIFTLTLMVLLLAGRLPSNLAFGLGFAVLLVLNYPHIKDQREYFRKQSGTVFHMVFTLFGVAVLVGINNGTGELGALARLIVNSAPAGAIAHIPFILCIFSLLLSITLGGAKNSVVLPAILPMVVAFGFTPQQLFGCVFACGIVSANLSLFNATPYLALGLAGVEMKDHLKYSLIPVQIFCWLTLLFMVVTGMMKI